MFVYLPISTGLSIPVYKRGLLSLTAADIRAYCVLSDVF